MALDVSTSKYPPAHPWKNTRGSRVGALTGLWRLNQPWKVRNWALGTGASAWTPMTFSTALRTGLRPSAALAMGAKGVMSLPSSSVRVMRRSRSGMRSRFMTARARALISAIFTPCGHTVVQMLHPEQ